MGSIWGTFQAEELDKDNNFLAETHPKPSSDSISFNPNAQTNVNSPCSELSTPPLAQALMKYAKQ